MSRRTGWFLVGGLLVALLLAGVVSNFASSDPDGLDATARQGCTFDPAGRITGGNCLARRERAHERADSPLAGYGIRGVDNPYLSTGLAGVVGVLITFGIGAGLFRLVRHGRPDGPQAAVTGTAAPGPAGRDPDGRA